MSPEVACKAIGATTGGSVAVECGAVILGIPKDLLFAAVAGACAGLAQRDKTSWQSFLEPKQTQADWLRFAGKAGALAFTVGANAIVCGWLAQLLQHLPLIEGVAQVAPIALAGVLAWMSQRILPAIQEAILARITKPGAAE